MSVGIAIIILESNFTKEGLLMSIQVTQYPDRLVQYPRKVAQYPGKVTQYPGRLVQYPGNVTQYPGRLVQYPGKVVRYATVWNQVRETAAAHPQYAVNTFAGQVYQRLCAQGYADKTVSAFISCATTLAFDHLEHVVRVGAPLRKDAVEADQLGQYFDAATLAALQQILAAVDFRSHEQLLGVYYLLLTDPSMQPVLAEGESDGEDMVRRERHGWEDEIGSKQKGGEDKIGPQQNCGEDEIGTQQKGGEDKIGTQQKGGEDKIGTQQNGRGRQDRNAAKWGEGCKYVTTEMD